MNNKDLKTYINSSSFEKKLSLLTCKDNFVNEKKRYLCVLDKAFDLFGDGDYHLITSPGRTEIGGNHTDHQHGNTISATLAIDNICAFKKNDSFEVTFIDPNFGEIELNLNDLDYKESDRNTSIGIIKGIAYKLKEKGYIIGGFKAYCDSRVLIGASISSSACFEIMIVEIFNHLYNDNKIGKLERALIGLYAENNYFGKASGLLDQLTISLGGLVSIDFRNSEKPIYNSFDFNFEDYGYKYLIVNTNGSHANLSDEYSSIPNEMKNVAKQLGVEYLADSSLQKLFDNMSNIRNAVKNDRAILRAIHFFNEDLRAKKEKEAVENKDIDSLLKLMIESGKSSYMYLQNVYSSNNVKTQNISLACAVTEQFLGGKGAYRIQGGGFEGTIISIVPNQLVDSYIELMNSIFGDNSVLNTSLRLLGTITII